MTSCVLSFRLWFDLVGILLVVWQRSFIAAVWFGGAFVFLLLFPLSVPLSAMLCGLFPWFPISASSSLVSVSALLFACAVVVVISLSWNGLLWVSEEEASFGSCVSPLFLVVGGGSLLDRIVVAIVLVLA